MEKKFAVIDLGSNSVRMIIMKVYRDRSYKMIDHAKEMVRLSEGMGEDNTLKPDAMRRTLHTLKLFKKSIAVHAVDQVFTIATAAVRNASNQRFFLDKMKRETGFDFDVISGDQEGYYDYLGVINTIQIDDCVIIDTGGASTELVLVKNRQVENVISLPYGAVVLTEKFAAKHEKTQAAVEKFMEEQFNEIAWLEEAAGLPVVGLGGSIRTLAKIGRKENGFVIETLHNYEMSLRKVTATYRKVVDTEVQERRYIPGVAKERGDIIAAGLVPVKVLMKILHSDKLIISGNGLREGVFYKNYLKGCKYRIQDVLTHSIDNILKNYDANMQHCYHVQKLALSLFDQTQTLHGLGAEERRLLGAAALLHDIGMYVDYYNHHKHGFYLILNTRLYGLCHRELVMCAFIVGMHRITELKQDWKEYKAIIDKDDYEMVKKLALFVRLAEKLDRNEYGSVDDIECCITDDSIQMMLKTNYDSDLEIAVAMKNEKAFEKVFDRKLCIV